MVYPLTRLQASSADAIAAAASLADPLQHLVDCHDRIEQRLQTLERLIPFLSSDSQDQRREALDALANALTFLQTMGALHTEDEEVSVFPRVLANARGQDPTLVELIAMLEEQHREKEGVFHLLLEQAAQLPDFPGIASADQLTRLQGTVDRLAGLYRPHIMVENQRLIPMAADYLTPADVDVIREEMRARRSNSAL